MQKEDRFSRYNKKLPVLSFRCDPKLKETLLKYGLKNNFVDDNGRPNMQTILSHIVNEYMGKI